MRLPDIQESIAHAMEADVRLLPLLPELLADVWELGTSAEDVIAVLQSAGIESGSTVIDLGCGKGPVAVALAERLGLRIEGVDAFEPFLESARQLARERGVGSRCVFRQGDIREILGQQEPDRIYDAVLLLSVGPLSGDHRKTVGDLRRLVRAGGLIVIDDGFLAEGVDDLPHAEGYAGHDETLRRLTAWGDELVREIVSSAEDTRAVNEATTELIRKRAVELARRNPDLVRLIDEYVARQEHETRVLGTDMVCATWVLRRARGS